MKKILVAVFIVIASTTSAIAAGPYIGAAGGVSIVHDGDVEVSGVGKAEAEYDLGYAFDVKFGYNFDPIRLEFELGYKKADMDKLGGFSVSDTELTAMSYMVNALYDFKNSSPVTPFIGVGFGAINGDIEVEGDSEDQTEFGIQAMVGMAFNINKNLAFDLTYKYQTAPSDFDKNGVSIEYSSSNIMAGLRYSF